MKSIFFLIIWIFASAICFGIYETDDAMSDVSTESENEQNEVSDDSIYDADTDPETVVKPLVKRKLDFANADSSEDQSEIQ